MKIYEVVSGGTKQHHPGGGKDWSVIVVSNTPEEACKVAWNETEQSIPWVVYEWGTSDLEFDEPTIIREMFESCPASNPGWVAYDRDPLEEWDPNNLQLTKITC